MKKLQRGLPKGRYSKYGYKRNSPDVNKPFNIIPSGRITMQDVDFPVRGVDNLGNEIVMMPGREYTFPGDYVVETPYKKGDESNASYNSNWLNKYQNAGQVSSKKKPMDWNQFFNLKNAQKDSFYLADHSKEVTERIKEMESRSNDFAEVAHYAPKELSQAVGIPSMANRDSPQAFKDQSRAYAAFYNLSKEKQNQLLSKALDGMIRANSFENTRVKTKPVSYKSYTPSFNPSKTYKIPIYAYPKGHVEETHYPQKSVITKWTEHLPDWDILGSIPVASKWTKEISDYVENLLHPTKTSEGVTSSTASLTRATPRVTTPVRTSPTLVTTPPVSTPSRITPARATQKLSGIKRLKKEEDNIKVENVPIPKIEDKPKEIIKDPISKLQFETSPGVWSDVESHTPDFSLVKPTLTNTTYVKPFPERLRSVPRAKYGKVFFPSYQNAGEVPPKDNYIEVRSGNTFDDYITNPLINGIARGLDVTGDWLNNTLQSATKNTLETMYNSPTMAPIATRIQYGVRPWLGENIRPIAYPGIFTGAIELTRGALGMNPPPFKDAQGDYSIEEEAWRKALGLQMNPKYIVSSNYKPSKAKNPNAQYYTFNKDVIDPQLLIAEAKRRNLQEGQSAVISSLAPYIRENFMPRDEFSQIDPLQDFTIGAGKDKKGKYISIYDKYDFEGPLNSFITPYEFYDRYYYQRAGQTSPTYFGGTLPTADIVSDNSGTQYPYYKNLTDEEKRFFSSNTPIGRAVRAKAQTGKVGQTYNDLSKAAKTIGKTAAEFTGVPGAVRFSRNPSENLKGALSTIEKTIIGTSPGVPQGSTPYDSKEVEGFFNTLDAAGLASMGAPLVKTGISGAKALPTVARQAGRYATTQTPLKNTWKLNPRAFKPNPEAYYRGIGRSGLDDALNSGVLRTGNKTGNYGEDLYMTPDFKMAKGIYSKDQPVYKGDPFGGVDDDFVEILPKDSRSYIAEIPKSSLKNPEGIGTKVVINKGSIPLDNIKLYKEDWLRGYKEVPKPKQLPGAGDLAANAAAKSSIFGDIKSGLQDLVHIYDQSLGYLFNNRANKKAIAEGNEWLRNWIQHPTTQAKIDKDFAGKINNSFVKNMYDVGYEQAKNFTPVSTELPLSVQLAKGFYPNKGNWGVSYLHHVDPMRRRMIEQGQMDAPIWHGSFISRTLDMPYKQRVGTTIHEGTHDWTSKFGLEASDQREFLERNINPEIHQDLEYWRRHGDNKTKTDLGKKRRYQAYLADPTEQHARIMELRKYLGHTPDFVSTPKYAQMVMDDLSAMRKNKRPIDSEGFFKVIDNDPQKLSNMFNRLWGVAPVAVAGAAAASEKQDAQPTMQKFGDNLNFQFGGYIPSWLNPMNWNVEDYSDKTDFNKAYSAAKKAGKEEFMFNGKRYNTKYAGTPRQEVGVYGVQGKPVHHMNLNDPAQVNLYPAFGKYLPGHISASIGDNQTSVDYSRIGNYPYGINKVKNKGEKSFNVYGQDNLTFSNKVASLPTGDYLVEDEYRPSDWNLFTNNCADNVCDAFGIPRSKDIQTPKAAMQKIQKKYPTLDVTGRTYDDYYDLGVKLRPISFHRPDEVLNQTKNLVGILSSPDLNNTKASEKITFALQNALLKKGYKLPKSINKDGELDGILGDETKAALEDWQKKNSKKQLNTPKLQRAFSIGGITTLPEAQLGNFPYKIEMFDTYDQKGNWLNELIANNVTAYGFFGTSDDFVAPNDKLTEINYQFKKLRDDLYKKYNYTITSKQKMPEKLKAELKEVNKKRKEELLKIAYNIKSKEKINLPNINPTSSGERFENYRKTGNIYFPNIRPENINASQDALYMHQRLPQKYNSFVQSKYKPTDSKNLNTIYYSFSPNVEKEIVNDLFKYDNSDFIKSKDKFRQVKGSHVAQAALKDFQYSKGKDKKGDYVAYYDINDYGNILDYIPNSKPFEIYNRIYYKDYGDGKPKRMYYSDKELLELDINKKNFDTLALQRELANRGYKLSKSTKKDGIFDGILGEETKKALEDWQKKNFKKQLGGALLKAQFGAFGTIPTSPPFMPQKENVVTSKKVDNLPKIKVNTTVPDEMITIKDGRKIRLTTGQAINPNTDLVGKSYPTKTLRSILDTAKNKGLSKDDALTLAAMDLQETRWGETDESIGHVLHGNDFAKSPVENFINAYLKSKETADRLKLSDEYTRLQVYNGLGTVTPDTEKDYHGFRMKKIYGVPVPASGINMRKNPLYGKQIVDIRDNVLKQNPEFLKLVDEYYKMGGVTNEMLDVYKNYINGVYTNTEKEKDAIKIYDKLNRKYYREAKNANKSVPNYIMSLIK